MATEKKERKKAKEAVSYITYPWVATSIFPTSPKRTRCTVQKCIICIMARGVGAAARGRVGEATRDGPSDARMCGKPRWFIIIKLVSDTRINSNRIA